MELDDLKNEWQNTKPDNQLSDTMIDKITRAKYNSSLKKVIYPELLGILICLGGAAYIGFNFSKLDTVFYVATGIFSILLLVVLPLLSLYSISMLNLKGNFDKTYSEALKEFAVQKMRFHKIQKANGTLSYLLLVNVIMLFPVLFGGSSLFDNKYFWIIAFCGGYIFLMFYERMVLKHYRKTLTQIEDLLKDLNGKFN